MQANEKDKKGGFIKGAVTVATGGFIAKIIGALYRIPLTNFIGGTGIGLYQMIYPAYCILLTVSATGIPSSIAKLTAERVSSGKSSKPLFATAMRLFVWIGLAGAVTLCLFAPLLSRLQESRETLGGYFALAPSVFIVSAISVFRGWFQGKNDMTPTALSEIVEQAVKVAVGLIFAYLFRENVVKAVTFLLLAVTVSEAFALLLLIVLYRRADKADGAFDGQKPKMRSILSLSVPVTFSAILFPLSSLIDSVLAVRLMGAYTDNAVALYGLFSGGAVTVVNLPVSVCYGIAVASIPAITKAKTELSAWKTLPEEEQKSAKKPNPQKRLLFAVGLTVAVALPCVFGLYLFAEPACKIVFRNLKGDELQTLVALIKAFSVSALTLSLVQTLSACLTAQGKPQYSALAMLVGVTAKTGIYAVLMQNPSVGVFGLAHATNIGYTVAFSLDLWYNIRCIKRTKE
ncbi:MAG: polysaccharide biosynthesis protein [Clostridia bacterium]|nr:polysaccharide biosynthesis protein [Clostridia bacterium]